MAQPFQILFGAGFTILVSATLGRMLLRRLGLTFFRQEENIFSFVAGSACLSLLLFILCALHVAYTGVLFALGAAILVLGWRWDTLRASGEPLPALSRFWKLVFGVPFWAFTVLYFFNAMAPEVSPDGSSYHLAMVARYARAHGFERITTNMYANLSQGIELLYLFAFSFGRHSATALVHFAFLVALATAVLGYARRMGMPGVGVCGSLLVYASPVVGIDGTVAYNDVALACVAFTLFYFLQVWAESESMALLVPAGLLAGFCYAIKYTGFVAIPYALGFTGWKLLRQRKGLRRAWVTIAATALLMSVPWAARNWINLGNPFSPFFNGVFPNPYVHVSFEHQYSSDMRHYPGLGSYWDLPLEVTVRGQVLGGLLGPIFLLAPLGLLALRSPVGRQLWLGALVFGATYPLNVGTRFLIAPAPFVALSMGLVIAQWRAALAFLALAHSLLSWPQVEERYCARYAWRIDRIYLREALRQVPEDAYINEKLFGYGIVKMINQQVPPGTRVLSFRQLPEAYCERDVLVGYQAASNEVDRDILLTPLMLEAIPQGRWRFRFPSQTLTGLRLVQTAADNGSSDKWSVSEIRVFSGEQELSRASGWRLTAHPNPWDVQLAFDNRPATRWRSWEQPRPGMSITIRLNPPAAADSFVVECSRDQYQTKLKLEGRNESGDWHLLSDAPEEREAGPPDDFRRDAIEALKARGIGYFVINNDDFGVEDYRTKASEWGITDVGDWKGYRLYRLD
jgi:hypothetical protein